MTRSRPQEPHVPDASRPRNGTTLRGEYAVNVVVDDLGLSTEARDDAHRLLHGAFAADACDERPPAVVGVAAVYAAVRLAELPRTRAEVVAASDVEREAVTRAYRSLVRAFGLCLSPPSPGRFVGRVVTDCDLPPAVEGRARTRLERVDTADPADPLGLAAAAAVVESDASAEDVAADLPLSALSLRSRYVPRVR